MADRITAVRARVLIVGGSEFMFRCVFIAVELLEHEMICWAELHVSAEKGVKSFD